MCQFFLPWKTVHSRTLKIIEFWLSSWYLSHLNLAVKFAVDAFDDSHWEQMLDAIWKLSVLRFSNVVNSTGHELSIVDIMFEISILRVRRTTQENNSFIKDQWFGAMKVRNEWSQGIASLNPLLVFAASSFSHFYCFFYSVKCSKSLTWGQYNLNSLQIFLFYWRICIDFSLLQFWFKQDFKTKLILFLEDFYVCI